MAKKEKRNEVTGETCLACGGDMEESVENRRYSSLVPIVIEDLRVLRCPSCGEEEVEIPRIEELNAVIARAIATQHSRLSPGQIRWLRTYLGYSSRDFATTLGVSAETVSRWENTEGPKQMSLPTEKLIRLMALQQQPIMDYSLPKHDASELEANSIIRLHTEDDHWRVAV